MARSREKDPKSKPVVAAVVSDLHAGSTIGLCPPIFNLDDGGTYRASRAQCWLWSCWLAYVERIVQHADRQGARIIAIINGDAIEGNHHQTTQVVSNNETTQMRIADAVLMPLLEVADHCYFVRGTPSHVGESARLEERIADNFTHTVRCPETGSATRWHLLLNINDVIFDIGHHGAIGRLPWTKANSVNRIAAQIIVEAHQANSRCPDVVLRAHWHQYADSGPNFSGIRVIAMPAFQLVTGYVNRLQPGAIADIGGLIFTCHPGGNYDMDAVRFRAKPTKPERVLLYG